MFLNLVFPYCTSEHLPKVPDTAKSMLHCSPSSHFDNNHPLACHTTAESAFTGSVPSQILLSITPGLVATILTIFFKSGHLKWYLHHHSKCMDSPCFMGKFKSPTKHHNSNFNTAEKYSTILSTRADTPKILILQQLRKTAPISRSSGVGTSQLCTHTVFSHSVIWTSLSPLSYYNGYQRV